MKLLQINTVYQNGSTGRICKHIDDEFRNANLGESKIVYFWGTKSNYNNVLKCAPNVYAKTMALKSRITGEYGFVSKFSTRRLISIIEEFAPDIIHLHNVHDHAIDLGGLFDYLNNSTAKLVWTFHDCWAFTGYCSHYTNEGCNKWGDHCFKCPLRKKYSWIMDKSGVLHNRKKNLYGGRKIEIITPSDWLASEVKKSFLCSNNISVINNGINLSVFKPTKSEFKKKYSIEGKKIILGVAYLWDERKGIDILVKLAKRVSDDYVIIIVGNIIGNRKKLPDNIIIIERTSNQAELVEIYSAADVFINPTREDNFPTVNLESLACGTPVITTNVGGSPECIDDSCGIVVEPENVNMLLQSVIDVCEQECFKMENCVKRAEKYDASKMYYKYIEKYLEMNKRNG